MYEGANFNLGGADFSDLAPKPPKTPEVKKDDDDDDAEEGKEKPKTLMDFLKKDLEKKEDSKKSDKEPDETNKSKEDEEDTDEESDPSSDAELDSDTPEITADEEQEVTSAILENRNEEIHKEADTAQTQEAKDEALAAGVFVEATKQAVDEGMPIDEAIDTGKAVAFEVLEIEEPDAESAPDNETETTTEHTSPEADIPEPVEIEPVDEDGSVITAGASTTIPPFHPTPPIPPTPIGGGPVSGGGSTLPITHNIAPTSPLEPESGNRVRTGRYLLAGGIVGYLLGRRRGRIKTEKKLLPIQRKLEKEVAGLHGKIAWHEASVRSMVQEQMAKKPETVESDADRQNRIEKLKAEQNPKSKNREQDSSQKLGKFGLAGERTSQSDVFKTPEKLKPVDLMTVPELLVIAEKIEIEHSTVRKLYETNRLDYEGLQRIVRAYLRGERLDRIVRENLLAPEKSVYPETLKTGASGIVQHTSDGGIDPYSSSDPKVLQKPQETSVLPILPTEFSQNDTGVKSNNPQKNAVIVGVVIAVILLIFIVFG